MNAIMFGQVNWNAGMLTIPIAALLVVVALVVVIRVIASRYVKVGPDEIAVFSGRKYAYKAADGTVGQRGFLILQGGGRILLPIVEKVEIINTAAFQVDVAETNVPNKENVGVNVKGVATCRLSLAEEDLANAVGNFLNKTVAERTQFIANILKGHVRSIVGNLTIDQLLRERQKLNDQVVSESKPECKRVGIEIINLVVQDVRDEHGFIEALGKQQIAQTKRNADIAVAEAERDTAVKTSTAKREAAEAEAQNATKTAEAQKLRDVQIANFKKETETTRAVAETAFAIAQAQQQQQLKVAEADRDSAATEAQTKVQVLEATRRQKELQATVITQAEADQRASVINADAARQVAELNAKTASIAAEGEKNAAIQTGEGEARKLQLTSAAQAEATRVTQTARADGEKANLLAQAEGEKAKLLAQAQGKEAFLLAEALGTDKLAEALAKLSEQGKLILVLDRLPKLLDHSGDAGAKIANAVFGSIAKSVEKIGTVTITDLGGGNTAKAGLSAIGGLIPQIATDLFTQAKGRGIDFTELFKLLKIDPTALLGLLGPAAAGATVANSAAPASEPPPVAPATA